MIDQVAKIVGEDSVIRGMLRRIRGTGTVFIVLAVLLLWIAYLNPNFTDPSVMLSFVRRSTPLMVLAAGQVFVVAAGGFDLSVGAGVTATVVVAARFIDGNEDATWPVIALLLIAGIVVGLINGSIVAFLKVPSFITTLGMLLILSGAVAYWSGGAPRGALSDGFRSLGREGWDIPAIGLVPYAAVIVVLVGGVSWWLLQRRPFGYQVLALGGNQRSTRLSGVATNRVRITTFVLSATSAVIAGILIGGIGGVSAQVGQGLEFSAITAVVLGGATLGGGKGSVPSVMAGALILAAIFTLMNLLGYSQGMRDIVQGVIVVAAVALFARRELRNE